MKINVFIEKSGKNKIVEASNIEEILKKLDINPETIIIVREKILITKTAKLSNNDKIKLLSVVSGG